MMNRHTRINREGYFEKVKNNIKCVERNIGKWWGDK
jgi:hypothetical protein